MNIGPLTINPLQLLLLMTSCLFFSPAYAASSCGVISADKSSFSGNVEISIENKCSDAVLYWALCVTRSDKPFPDQYRGHTTPGDTSKIGLFITDNDIKYEYRANYLEDKNIWTRYNNGESVVLDGYRTELRNPNCQLPEKYSDNQGSGSEAENNNESAIDGDLNAKMNLLEQMGASHARASARIENTSQAYYEKRADIDTEKSRKNAELTEMENSRALSALANSYMQGGGISQNTSSQYSSSTCSPSKQERIMRKLEAYEKSNRGSITDDSNMLDANRKQLQLYRYSRSLLQQDGCYNGQYDATIQQLEQNIQSISN